MSAIIIKKSTGETEPLDLEKVRRAVARSGASEEVVERVVHEVERRAYNGMPTFKIYALVKKLLERTAPGAARRYDLRAAIIKLGPAGFEFEKYIAALLAAHGYKTELPPILQGACITHEVDVLATKDNRTAMIEAKLRHEPGIFITIKDTTHTWTRFLDINDAAKIGRSPHFDECWIVTNTRFSHDSTRFGACKGMSLIGWDIPRERPLPAWIDEIGLYPVTILKNVNEKILTALGAANILLLHDFVGLSLDALRARLKLPGKVIARLVDEGRMILQK